MMNATVSNHPNKTASSASAGLKMKPVDPSKRRSCRIIMASIVMQMMLRSSKAYQLVPCSTLPLVMLLAATRMQGCFAKALPDQPLLEEDSKNSNEKIPGALRRLKKSTKSTKSDLVNPTPDEDNGEFVQLGKDIPRTEDDIWNVNMVSMSENGLRFADSNNVYQYDESSQSWESLSPDSFTGYSILGMSGDGQNVLAGNLSDSFMSLELRTFAKSEGIWKLIGGGDISYTALNSPLLGDGIMTENYAKLSHNGKRVVVTDGSGIRVFEISSGTTWVQIGDTIDSGVSREIAINDDGNQVCFSTDYVDDMRGPGAVVSVYRHLVTDRSGGSWKQIGGYLVDGGYYGWYSINFDMNSSGNRIIVGYSDGSGRYYSGDAKVFEYSEEINEWEQVANDLGGGTHVKMSADGSTVAVGRHQDLEYLWSGPDGTCCDTHVRIYKLWQGDGELYWEKVATINSGPRYYFGYEIIATSTLHRFAVAAKESYSVYDVTFSTMDGPCIDQEGAKFSLINVNKEVGCDWLTSNSRREDARRTRYCTQRYDDGSVIEACRRSCGMCPSN